VAVAVACDRRAAQRAPAGPGFAQEQSMLTGKSNTADDEAGDEEEEEEEDAAGVSASGKLSRKKLFFELQDLTRWSSWPSQVPLVFCFLSPGAPCALWRRSSVLGASTAA